MRRLYLRIDDIERLLFVDTGKENASVSHAIACLHAAEALGGTYRIKRGLGGPKLRIYLLRGGGDDRLEHDRRPSYGFGKIVKHRSEASTRRFVACKHPRLCFIDELVCAAQEREDRLNGIRNAEVLHRLAVIADSGDRRCN